MAATAPGIPPCSRYIIPTSDAEMANLNAGSMRTRRASIAMQTAGCSACTSSTRWRIPLTRSRQQACHAAEAARPGRVRAEALGLRDLVVALSEIWADERPRRMISMRDAQR